MLRARRRDDTPPPRWWRSNQTMIWPPLADSVESGLDEERIAGEDFERLHGAVGGDDGVKFYAALASDLHREGRINGLNASEQLGFLHETADSHDMGRRRSAYLLGRFGSARRVGKRHA